MRAGRTARLDQAIFWGRVLAESRPIGYGDVRLTRDYMLVSDIAAAAARAVELAQRGQHRNWHRRLCAGAGSGNHGSLDVTRARVI
ncbi:MAG: hypothetical protein M3302_00500 [Actinomycetota bacterium]|nr:hypothetical protein [Actinomycetota bacterium]